MASCSLVSLKSAFFWLLPPNIPLEAGKNLTNQAVAARFLKPSAPMFFASANSGAILETEVGTYADKNAAIKQSYVMWNHGVSEVLSNLIKHGLEIKSFDEFDYSPYNCFNKTIEFEPNRFRIEHLGDKIPMVYSISAIKKS